MREYYSVILNIRVMVFVVLISGHYLQIGGELVLNTQVLAQLNLNFSFDNNLCLKELIGIPDEKIIVKFMKEYRNEIIKIQGYDCGLNEINTIKNLVREAKLFLLASNLLLVLFCMKTNEEKEVGYNKEFFMVFLVL
jgi:hypothetical protein